MRFLYDQSLSHELVGFAIAPFHDTLKLLVGPGIEIHGLNPTNVRAHSSVDSRASNANEDTQIP